MLSSIKCIPNGVHSVNKQTSYVTLAPSIDRSAGRRNPACCVHCTALFTLFSETGRIAGKEKERREESKAMTALQDTEDASETDLAKHDEDDYVEIKEQMYQDKLASLKRQLQQLQEGTLQEYQKRMKKLDQQYKERLRNADLFLQLETEQVERNYIKEKKAAVKEFDDKKVELKENLIAELEEKKKMIENEKLTMELTGDSMEVKPIMTRKLRRRPNDPVPIPDKRRKPAPAQLNYLLTDDQIMEDLRTLNKLKSPKRPVSPSSPEHVPSAPMESPSQRYEARIEEGKLYYDKRWYHKSQAIYLESKDNTKISCVISSVGTNEIWVRKTSDSTKMRIYLGQLQRGAFIIRRRSAA
ncbi:sin3 histone deacetylase corepressor complex component SDS3 isoform X1 [Cottoperca gobio]|uniref:Sin3 histone deacetylase corepressor complex component SDS3 isoform X1 n=2 Tax=Notothenioidei TaxID=8205 RepID=A0A6J2QE05_COTGO|nr:sin3 histone deacetylase corepressor complex component SDS3 isoform X1 [Cottoperca gobio]